MSSYQRVYSTVWDQAWTQDGRYVAFYLMTCKHRVTEGLFRLPRPYMWADLQWSPERFDQGFTELLTDGFAEYDDKAQVVLLPAALELQQPANPNNVKAAVKAVKRVPETLLFQRFYRLAERFAEPFAKGLMEAYPERLLQPVSEPIGDSHSSQLSSLKDLESAGTRGSGIHVTAPVENVEVEQPNLSVVDDRGVVA